MQTATARGCEGGGTREGVGRSACPRRLPWGRRRGLLLCRAAPWAWGQLLPHVRCHFPTAALQTAHLFVQRVFYPRHTEGLAQPAHLLARGRILLFAHRTHLFDARRRAAEEPPLHPRTRPRTRPVRLASPQVLTPPTISPPLPRRQAQGSRRGSASVVDDTTHKSVARCVGHGGGAGRR